MSLSAKEFLEHYDNETLFLSDFECWELIEKKYFTKEEYEKGIVVVLDTFTQYGEIPNSKTMLKIQDRYFILIWDEDFHEEFNNAYWGVDGLKEITKEQYETLGG